MSSSDIVTWYILLQKWGSWYIYCKCGDAEKFRYHLIIQNWCINITYWQYFFLGNITTLTVVRCKKLDLKVSFLSLISLICLFDIFLILNNVFIFSLPIINPFYRHQVSYSKNTQYSYWVLFPGVPSVGAMGAPLGPDLPDWLCADHHYHCHGETPLCCQVKTYICKPWYMWRMIMFFILQADWCYYLYLYTVTECVELHQKHLFSFYGLNNDYCQENSSWMTQQKFHTQCQCQRHDTLCPSKALQSFNV